MELTYGLTQKDFYESFLVHRKRTVISKWSFRLMSGLIFIVPTIGLLTLITNPGTKFVTIAPLFILAVIWAIFIWGTPWWTARSQFLQQPAAKGSRTMTLDGSGVHWRWNAGQADVNWTNFIRFVESKTLFLLYTSPACFNIVPKRAFAPSEVESFRGLLHEKLGLGVDHNKISPRVTLFLVVVAVALMLLVMTIRNVH